LRNSYPLLFNDPPAVANMTLSLSYALIQIGHRKPPQSLPLNVRRDGVNHVNDPYAWPIGAAHRPASGAFRYPLADHAPSASESQ
jgi:hypothetical protein